MIKTIMSVVAAAAITLTSALAVVANQKAPKLEDLYVKIDDCYLPATDAMEIGHCVPNGETCLYERIQTGDDCDNTNFQSLEDGQRFQLD